ncbi:hypothetical protein F5887DRAFT_535813 [Amanita rubescens]|nr:hypothetical protein F5887DRAFT_535813 [Amanita rubescens]
MSTRTPFFLPGSRQEPRTNDDQQEKTGIHPSEDQDPLTEAPEKKKDTNDVNNNPSAEKDNQHKPLNVNGLIRSRTHPKLPQRILVNGGNIPRPGTADPSSDGQHFATHTTNIVAPMPFKASRIAPPLLLNASNTPRPISPLNFKAPAPPYMHQTGDTFSNNAHIPTGSHNSSHEDVPVHLRSASSLGVSRNVQGVPDGKNADNSAHRVSNQQYACGKRKQSEAINAGQYQKTLKRFKGENILLRKDPVVEKTEAELSLSHESCAINSVSDYGWSHRPTLDVSGKDRSDINREENGNWAANIINTQRDYSGALDDILGRDVNNYVEEHLVDKYVQISNKWKECSLGEWSAGAEGGFSLILRRKLTFFLQRSSPSTVKSLILCVCILTE